MKILYTTTVGGTMSFFISLIRELLDMGHIIDIATNESWSTKTPDCYREWGCKIFPISCTRSPCSILKNLRAIKEIRKIILEGKYDIVHCHTPIASFCIKRELK